ncbi:MULTISPECIES: hypothetical protein [unclassified Sphingobacterium]|uniref:hypothetical protein n=1 Tax=unclassified Sphingobacterium TaxID=2609468 RepID=UPI00104CFB14|nr:MULTISPECIES: hypothetical protein [unclassified Sphingobacterium]MCS3556180.1 hypothetical protein [Sphingobacterium sp. JUb21]TCR08556.1 hypothetical protein EDF66_103103 [Sphingobacterium sp. JUb20]
MKKYEKIAIIFIAFIAICTPLILVAQTDKDIRSDLSRLRNYSIKYDTHVQSMPTKYPEEMKIAEKKYRDQINKIKNGSNKALYLKFLDKATGIDSLKYKDVPGMNYIAMNTVEMQVIRSLPTQLEYYKVVKYSLFILNKDELIRPENVPFLRYKEKLRKRPTSPFK